MKIKHLLLLIVVLMGAAMFGCSQNPELEWHQEEGYQWAELNSNDSGEFGFKQLSSAHTNISITNTLAEEDVAYNRVLLNGSGVAAGDIDGDGLTDLYFTRLDGSNKLYKNLGGFQFQDITETAGVAHENYLSTGAVFADVDGNHTLDLLITSINRENSLYLNDGKGNFTLKENSGLSEARGSMSMALSDVNGNGYPDLYIANYKKRAVQDLFRLDELSSSNIMKDGQLVPPFDEHLILFETDGEVSNTSELGEKDQFYINNSDGTFGLVTDPENVFLDSEGNLLGFTKDWGLSAKFYDLNNDGHSDLYVSNDFWTPDRIWMNQGDGTFRALDTLAVRNSSFSSMSADFSDINRDGFTDMFVVEMLATKHEIRLRQMKPQEPYQLFIGDFVNRPRYNRNSLYLNRGDHTFSEISYYSGLEASDWSWSTKFMDVDLDGYEDVIISTGFMYDLQDLDAQQEIHQAVSQDIREWDDYILRFPKLRQQNKIFRNNGDLTFTDVSGDWGFNDEDITHGMAVADLNNDGSLDLVLNRMDQESVIYQNKASASRIAVRLEGMPPNTEAIGAKIKLHGGLVLQEKEIISGGDYLSGSDKLIVFAADTENQHHAIEVIWPGGERSRIDSVRANRIYKIDQSSISKETRVDSTGSEPIKPFFKDISKEINHHHHEEPFDDFSLQPLLPYKLSQAGPGISWIDMDLDGDDDLFIGSGRGGQLSVFENEGNGNLSELELSTVTNSVSDDVTTILGWTEEDKVHLIAGRANYEESSPDVSSLFHYQLQEGEVVRVDSLPGIRSVTGPLAVADYDGDGDIDLFEGGRFIATQYPIDATSRMFKNEDGTFRLDEENASLFRNIGLVTSAMFVDYDIDGDQDLFITTEWGPVKVFENNGGLFSDRTSELGLDQYNGLWNGIASGDFNNDGYPDLVVTNRGLNSNYQVESKEHPLRMYYSNFNRRGEQHIFEAYYDETIGDYVPRRQYFDYESAFGAFKGVQSHQQYASSTLNQILIADIDRLPYKSVNTLEQMVFMNQKGQEFTLHPLPAEAQFSSAQSAVVTDFDNDGNEDIFLSQNFFAVTKPQQNPRMDGGRGLWLKGNGEGDFEAIPGHISGIKIYGEQRGTALSDFNGDGKIDLAVAQNGADTKLYINQAKERGIRVRLVGPDNNQNAIGASLRLIYEDESKGPRRTIQTGSGYWSQNSGSQVLGISGNPVSIEIHWPDGTQQIIELEKDEWDYLVRYED